MPKDKNRLSAIPRQMPRPGDTLFKPVVTSSVGSRTSTTIATVHGRWLEYARQYKDAADRLIRVCQNGNVAIFPALFLYRHFLELQLKAILGPDIVIEHVTEQQIDADKQASCDGSAYRQGGQGLVPAQPLRPPRG